MKDNPTVNKRRSIRLQGYDYSLPGAYFITVGRGGTVVTDALVEALESGRLAGAGLDVTVVNDGQDGVDAAMQNHYDVILMDIQMPVMDGLEATREIRESEAGNKHTNIVAMTAYALKSDIQRCLDAGMDDYVSKPIKVNELFAVIERLA